MNARRHVSFERERGVYDVQVTRDVAHLAIPVDDQGERSVRIGEVFRSLASAAVPIFFIKLQADGVSCALPAGRVADALAALERSGFRASSRSDLAIVSIVASSMRDLIGVMVRIADALQDAGAWMHGVGDSHSTVQCLVEAASADDAVRELRRAFGLEAPGA